MANTLNIASEIDAYTISDKGTWLSFKNKNNLKILLRVVMNYIILMELLQSILKNFLMLSIKISEVH